MTKPHMYHIHLFRGDTKKTTSYVISEVKCKIKNLMFFMSHVHFLLLHIMCTGDTKKYQLAKYIIQLNLKK